MIANKQKKDIIQLITDIYLKILANMCIWKTVLAQVLFDSVRSG